MHTTSHTASVRALQFAQRVAMSSSPVTVAQPRRRGGGGRPKGSRNAPLFSVPMTQQAAAPPPPMQTTAQPTSPVTTTRFETTTPALNTLLFTDMPRSPEELLSGMASGRWSTEDLACAASQAFFRNAPPFVLAEQLMLPKMLEDDVDKLVKAAADAGLVLPRWGLRAYAMAQGGDLLERHAWGAIGVIELEHMLTTRLPPRCLASTMSMPTSTMALHVDGTGRVAAMPVAAEALGLSPWNKCLAPMAPRNWTKVTGKDPSESTLIRTADCSQPLYSQLVMRSGRALRAVLLHPSWADVTNPVVHRALILSLLQCGLAHLCICGTYYLQERTMATMHGTTHMGGPASYKWWDQTQKRCFSWSQDWWQAQGYAINYTDSLPIWVGGCETK